MSHTPGGTRPRRRFRFSLKRVLIVFTIIVAIGVALPFGCVGNRQFNLSPEDSLRRFTTAGGLPYAVAVVEFDDQGEPWDMVQLDAAVGEIRRLNGESDHGIVLYQFIHGWKSNASRDPDSGMRLAWFESEIAAIAEQSEAATRGSGEAPRPIVGLFVGWRGRTYSLPVLIDASFWNRRVAAHRMASMRLVEVLQRTLHAVNEAPDAKCVLLGHSMGGLILEKTLGSTLVSDAIAVESSEGSVALGYDLIVSANSSGEALYTKQLIDVFKRSSVELVLEDRAGNQRPAAGPMMASITSGVDVVTRWMVPFAMTLNSVFVRYRDSVDSIVPSQRYLGLHTAGHVPYLFSHSVEMRGGHVELSELPGRWNDTPFWVFQVPAEISGDHGDISNPLWGRLMMELMERNRVFDPALDLRLANVERVLNESHARAR